MNEIFEMFWIVFFLCKLINVLTILHLFACFKHSLSSEALASKNPGLNSSLATELLEILDCVNKFTNFAEGMRIKASQFLCRDENDADDPFNFGRRC